MADAQPRAVVFDLDGLMFNTEELYQFVGAEILRRRDREFSPELLDAMMGRPDPVALQIMIDWHDLEDTVQGLAAESDEVFDAILEERLEPMPGLLELLNALERADLPKAVATSIKLNMMVLWARVNRPAESVRRTPLLVTSNCQASRNTNGNPRISAITTKVGNHSGRRNGSTAASINCRIANTATAYAPTVRSTLRRDSSATTAEKNEWFSGIVILQFLFSG